MFVRGFRFNGTKYLRLWYVTEIKWCDKVAEHSNQLKQETLREPGLRQCTVFFALLKRFRTSRSVKEHTKTTEIVDPNSNRYHPYNLIIFSCVTSGLCWICLQNMEINDICASAWSVYFQWHTSRWVRQVLPKQTRNYRYLEQGKQQW